MCTHVVARLALSIAEKLVPTLPTLATSRFAASKMKMTPCLLELAATSSCSAGGGARPPTMLLLNCFVQTASFTYTKEASLQRSINCN